MEVIISGAVIKLSKYQIAKIEEANTLLQLLKNLKSKVENDDSANKWLSSQIQKKKNIESLSRIIELVKSEKYK